MSCNVCLTVLAITDDASLYTTSKSDIGRQFFKLNLDLFDFGKHVINPCFCAFTEVFFFTYSLRFQYIYHNLQVDVNARILEILRHVPFEKNLGLFVFVYSVSALPSYFVNLQHLWNSVLKFHMLIPD